MKEGEMTSLAIGGTCFLNPGHRAWLNLKNNFGAYFLDYGDIASISSVDRSESAYASVLYLDDLIQYEDEESEEAIKEKLGPISSQGFRRTSRRFRPNVSQVCPLHLSFF